MSKNNPALTPRMSANKTQVGGDHYISMAVQPWDVIGTWEIEDQIAYFRGNAIKYLMRFGAKRGTGVGGALEDSEKAMHYIQKMIEIMKHR